MSCQSPSRTRASRESVSSAPLFNVQLRLPAHMFLILSVYWRDTAGTGLTGAFDLFEVGPVS